MLGSTCGALSNAARQCQLGSRHPAYHHSVYDTAFTQPLTLIPPTRSVFVNKGALPGSNGSDARANAAGAGLVIIFVGEFN